MPLPTWTRHPLGLLRIRNPGSGMNVISVKLRLPMSTIVIDADIGGKVRQFSVLFPDMAKDIAIYKANKCLITHHEIDEIRYLIIDEAKKACLDESDLGVRIFFHTKESKNDRWRKRLIEDFEGHSWKSIHFMPSRRKGENKTQGEKQHLKLWDDPKYRSFTNDFGRIKRSDQPQDPVERENNVPATDDIFQDRPEVILTRHVNFIIYFAISSNLLCC